MHNSSEKVSFAAAYLLLLLPAATLLCFHVPNTPSSWTVLLSLIADVL